MTRRTCDYLARRRRGSLAPSRPCVVGPDGTRLLTVALRPHELRELQRRCDRLRCSPDRAIGTLLVGPPPGPARVRRAATYCG